MSGAFQSLVQELYHTVSIGPFEARVNQIRFSDFVLHMPVVEWFASQCDHITEFGIREGYSTVSLLQGAKIRLKAGLFDRRPEVHSWDIHEQNFAKWLDKHRDEVPCHWEFHCGDTGTDIPVEETDLLLIDTLHTYSHVSKELHFHGRKARKYLIFHDTLTCGEFDLSGPNPKAEGITRAINEFIDRYPGQYRLAYHSNWSNGLEVFERVG